MATKIILLTDVDNLGLRGDVVDVASGYARNYLLPRRMAETATPAKVAELEKREAHRARHDARSGDEARALATKLEALELRFDVNAGPTGTLFGSITATDIAERIREESGIRIDKRKIHIEPIKRVGRYEIEIGIFEDVTATVRTLVLPPGGELPPEEPEAPEAPEEPEVEVAAEAETEAPVAEVELEEPADEIVAEAADGTLGQTGEPESA